MINFSAFLMAESPLLPPYVIKKLTFFDILLVHTIGCSLVKDNFKVTYMLLKVDVMMNVFRHTLCNFYTIFFYLQFDHRASVMSSLFHCYFQATGMANVNKMIYRLSKLDRQEIYLLMIFRNKFSFYFHCKCKISSIKKLMVFKKSLVYFLKNSFL